MAEALKVLVIGPTRRRLDSLMEALAELLVDSTQALIP